MESFINLSKIYYELINKNGKAGHKDFHEHENSDFFHSNKNTMK